MIDYLLFPNHPQGPHHGGVQWAGWWCEFCSPGTLEVIRSEGSILTQISSQAPSLFAKESSILYNWLLLHAIIMGTKLPLPFLFLPFKIPLPSLHQAGIISSPCYYSIKYRYQYLLNNLVATNLLMSFIFLFQFYGFLKLIVYFCSCQFNPFSICTLK